MRIILAALLTFLIAFLTQYTAHAEELELPVCKTVSEGIYNGYWVKHRILIDYVTVYGANDLDSILSQLEILREQGLCR